MTIKKGGLLYKIAYGLSLKYDRPNQTNLCRFFWRLMFMIFIGWPTFLCVVLPLVGLSLAAFTVTLGVIGLPFGYRPDYDTDHNRYLRRCKKWPTIKGYRILPIYLVLLAGFVWALPYCWPYPMILALLTAVIIGLLKLFKTEAWKVLKAYLGAKKAKVCPTIKFE